MVLIMAGISAIGPKGLKLSKNRVTKLFKSASHYFSDNPYHVVNALV